MDTECLKMWVFSFPGEVWPVVVHLPLKIVNTDTEADTEWHFLAVIYSVLK